MGDELKVTLKVLNIDDEAWTFSGALHTYLNVGDIKQAQTTGMGNEYIDSLKNSEVCQGGEVLQLTDTIDRVYTQPEAQILVKDPVLNRTLSVANRGHNSAVLWNPWAEGAQGWETWLTMAMKPCCVWNLPFMRQVLKKARLLSQARATSS